MPTLYKNARGQHAVQEWCSRALARAKFPIITANLATSVGPVAVTSAGTGRPRVVMIPGTGFNAAVALPWLQALSEHWATAVVDLPGQPGLSDPRRPRRGRLAWYGRTLDDILATLDVDSVVVVGNSLGRAVALAATSKRIAARVLVSPGGFIRLGVDPKLVLASAVWLARPTVEHTRRMLRLFVAPGADPPETEVEWMAGLHAVVKGLEPIVQLVNTNR